MKTRDITKTEAQRIAKRFGVKLPPVGYQVGLGDGRWLCSTGHFQFGWFGRPADVKPFSVECRCDETLRHNEPRGCPKECPNAAE